MNTWNMVLSKMFSARFIISVGLAVTLCILACFVVVKRSDNKELLALIVGQFIFVCKDVILKYFDRQDRGQDGTPDKPAK